jgi:glutathione S-transferase
LWLTTAFFRYFEMDIERPGVPNVEAQDVWFHQQPAYQEHGMLSFENLFTQLAY